MVGGILLGEFEILTSELTTGHGSCFMLNKKQNIGKVAYQLQEMNILGEKRETMVTEKCVCDWFYFLELQQRS